MECLNHDQLEQLVAYADEGTLSAAAEKLLISQPALSKSMKRIEEVLGVRIFIREKNRLHLNQTGIFAVEQARKVLQTNQELVHAVREYDRRLRTIRIASCAPYPIWNIAPEISDKNPGNTITTEILMPDQISEGLDTGFYDIGVLPYPVEKKGYVCRYWGEENLCFSLPDSHPLARRDSLNFADLDGSKILVFSEIGFWDAIHRKNMPHTDFIFMSNRDDIQVITSISEIPTFYTREGSKPLPEGRIGIPIRDADAHVRFYTIVKKGLTVSKGPAVSF